ncbi:hypothetical protein QTP88_008376 [Uroleucon formosanum]
MLDKRITYKKAAKEKLEKTDNLLRKIPKPHSYFAATNPEKTESELKKNSSKKIDEIESCLAGAYEIRRTNIRTWFLPCKKKETRYEASSILNKKNVFPGKFQERKQEKRFFDENETDEAVLESSQKMKCEVFLVIIDRLIINLHKRKLAYTELHKNFGFILVMESIDTDNIHDSAKNLVQLYSEDLDSSFIEEAVQFKSILSFFSTQEKSSFINLLKCLTDSPLLSSFPNVEIAMRIFCCMASTNASGERSFSVIETNKKLSKIHFKLMKNCHRFQY